MEVAFAFDVHMDCMCCKIAKSLVVYPLGRNLSGRWMYQEKYYEPQLRRWPIAIHCCISGADHTCLLRIRSGKRQVGGENIWSGEPQPTMAL